MLITEHFGKSLYLAGFSMQTHNPLCVLVL